MTWLRRKWWWVKFALRHCPECGERGYDPARIRWADDPIVARFGFRQPGDCDTCGGQLTQTERGAR